MDLPPLIRHKKEVEVSSVHRQSYEEEFERAKQAKVTSQQKGKGYDLSSFSQLRYLTSISKVL